MHLQGQYRPTRSRCFESDSVLGRADRPDQLAVRSKTGDVALVERTIGSNRAGGMVVGGEHLATGVDAVDAPIIEVAGPQHASNAIPGDVADTGVEFTGQGFGGATVVVEIPDVHA